MRLGAMMAAIFWFVNAAAQQSPRLDTFGVVTGHVTCSDTQRPARLARVKLVRVPAKAEIKPVNDRDPNSDAAAPVSGNEVETSLDGSYTIRKVAPGAYYVVVDADGYLIPLAQFSAKDLVATDDATRAKVAKAVHVVAVEGEHVAQEDVVIDRGASISGTITYDDGTPASGIGIELLAKDKNGKWVEASIGRYRMSAYIYNTDDNGHYRITGLPAGEYATQANLSVSDHETTTGPMPGSPATMMTLEKQTTRFALPLYSGDVLRKTEATGYTLGSGEVRAGSDLVFPLAKLHKVGGQVLAKDGHAVNGGDVKLLWADDQSEMTETSVQFDDAMFHLEFVPEGAFTLKVSTAKDLTKVQVENAPGYSPRFHDETKILKTYPDGSAPLMVVGETSDVIVTLPAQ